MDDFLNAASFGRLTGLDLVIVLAAILLLFAIAYFTGRREEDTRDFFLGKRSVPWVVACLSFVAAEISAVTIISVPGRGYAQNLQYLQFAVGTLAARLLVAFLFIPVFYKHDCTTIYEFLRHRFGAGTRYAGSAFFFLTRLLASGVRLALACGAVAIIMEWSFAATLILFTLVSIVFIAFGGIKAVMWTGAYEALMFYGAGLAVAAYLVFNIDGGLGEALRLADAHGRLSLLNWGFDPASGAGFWRGLGRALNQDTTFWGATLNAFFIGLVVFGTDQDFMQRLLSVKTRAASQKTLIATFAAGLPLTVLYLGIGTLLFAFFQQHPAAMTMPAKTDHILPTFTAQILPTGLRGLVLATVLLASIDSPLMSLSSSFVTDIYRPLINRHAGERHCLWVSRAGVVFFGVVLAGLAWLCQGLDAVLWVSFQIMGMTGGPLLGIFLLGLLTRKTSGRGSVWAMVIGGIVSAGLLAAIKLKLVVASGAWLGYELAEAGNSAEAILPLGWTWLIVIGTAVTFGLGAVLGRRR